MDKSDREVSGVTNWQCLREYLPSDWLDALGALPPQAGDRVQEIRLRAEEPIRLSLPAETRLLGEPPMVCDRGRLEECFLRFCQHAVYAHEWELSQGFLSVPGGIRVGVGGRAVLEGERVRTVRDVTSLCVRLPRRMAGCSAPLQRRMTASGYPVSTLLIGPPSSGKTTLLRDLAAGLAHRFRVTVVDERGELAGIEGLAGCDVLMGYPKAIGLRQAVRCLAPDVVLFDELGTPEEVEAVSACAHAGVAVVATLHGYSPADLTGQPLTDRLIKHRAFRNWAFLAGRQTPGRIAGWYQPEVKENGIRWTSADRVGGGGAGSAPLPPSDWTGGVFAPDGTVAGNFGTATGLHALSDAGTVGTADRYAGVF